MKRIHTYCLLSIMLLMSIAGQSQSDLLYSNMDVNAIAFNPAAIEDNQAINTRLLIRQQWVGFSDAPKSQWLNVSHFFDKYNSGLALNVYNQSAGAEQSQNVKLNYTYKFFVARDHRLAFGLGGGLFFRKLDFSKLTFEEVEEQIPISDDRQLHADFDFGIEYNFKNLTIGISSNHITTTNEKATIYKVPIQNHVYAKYLFALNDELSIIPALAYHRSAGINLFDFSADIIIMERINVGLAYRLETSLILRAGIKLNDVFELHYAYDLGTGKFRSYHSGSHEFMLIARFKKRSSIYNSPRFF